MKKLIFIVICSSLISGAVFASGGQEKPADGPLVFWDKSEYVADYNILSEARFKAFLEREGLKGEYVIMPPNDLKPKLMAGIEAGSTPDIAVTDDFLAKQFAGMDQLVDVGNIMSSVKFLPSALNMAFTRSGNYIVPLSFLAPGMYIRKDKWDEYGLELSSSWMDLKASAEKITDPENNFYGLGLPMGASGGGDAEGLMRNIILGFGGVPVTADNQVTINSPETLEALKFISSIYKEGLTPPSSITWDDMGNNTAYLAGSVGMTMNSGSIYSAMQKEHPDLLEKTVVLPFPAGPAGRFTPGGGNVFVIFKKGQNTPAAEKFITEFFEKDFYENLVIKIGGMWQPTVEGMDQNAFWQKKENKGWLESSKSIIPNTFPAEPDQYSTRAFSEQLCVKAVQKIVVNNMDPQQALDELEAEFLKIYK